MILNVVVCVDPECSSRYIFLLLFPCSVLSDPDTDRPGEHYCDSSLNSTQVMSKYSVSSVADEYIVQFRGFYPAPTRARYITRALSIVNMSCTVVTRDNPMSGHPSDFDIITCDLNPSAKEALLSHPLVKSVTPQMKLTRSLKEVPDQQSKIFTLLTGTPKC